MTPLTPTPRYDKMPAVHVPTPEEADAFDRNHGYFWLSKDRKSYTGKNHAAMLVEHKDLFGFTQAEVDRVMEPLADQGEMRDRYLHLYEEAIERGWICIMLNKIATLLPSVPVAVFWFYAETPDVYERIKDWLSSKDIKSGIVRLRTLMMRSWDQPVKSLFAGAQFSRTGAPTCQVCGTVISTDELISRGICPKCGNPLW